MMAGSGYLKNRARPENQMKFLKRKEIITWKEDIRPSATSCRVMLPAVQQKKDAMPVMVWELQSRPYTSTMQQPSNVMEKLKPINWDCLMLMLKKCGHSGWK